MYACTYSMGRYRTKVYLTSPEPSTISHNSLIFYRISEIETPA